MSETSFTYPFTAVQVDFGTSAAYMDLPVKIDCGATTPPGVATNPDLGWNCNLCGSDDYYQQPVSLSDKIYLQLKFIDKRGSVDSGCGWNDGCANWFVDADIIDTEGNLINGVFTSFATEYVAANAAGQDYQNLVINVDGIGISTGCFIIKFTYRDENGATTEYFSEPYDIIDTACIETVLMEGVYSNYDCNTNYYGIAGDAPDKFFGTSNFAFRNLKRYFGTIVKTGQEIKKEVTTKGVVKRIDIKDEYLLRLDPVPPYEADNVNSALSSITIKIGNFEFNEAGSVDKNNDTGAMWNIRTIVKKECGKDVDVFKCD